MKGGVRALLKVKLNGKRKRGDQGLEGKEDREDIAPSIPFSNENCIFGKPEAVWLQSHLSVFYPGLQIFGKVLVSSSFVPRLMTITSSHIQLSKPGNGKVLERFQFTDIFCIKRRDMPNDERMKFSRNIDVLKDEAAISDKMELERDQFAILTTKEGYHRGRVLIFATTRSNIEIPHHDLRRFNSYVTGPNNSKCVLIPLEISCACILQINIDK